MSAWARFPAWWAVKQEFHEQISSAPVGRAIAALKLYIALCIRARRLPDDTAHPAGRVQISLGQLQTATGLSRPLVVWGLRLLVGWGLVLLIPGRPASYDIVRYAVAGEFWTKLPSGHFLEGSKSGRIPRLSRISNRSSNSVRALQMYAYMLCTRQRSSGYSRVGYERLAEVLRFDRNQVSQAISTLVNLDLVTVRHSDVDDFSTVERPSNVYWIRGLRFSQPGSIGQRPGMPLSQ